MCWWRDDGSVIMEGEGEGEGGGGGTYRPVMVKAVRAL